MKNLINKYIAFIILLILFSGCKTISDVILPQGQKTTELLKAKDEQIATQSKQITDLKSAREQDKKQASLAAANFDGVLYGAEHVEPGLPRNAIEEEAKLGKARLPEADPQEVIKAKDRVIAILQNEVAKAKEMYGKAFDEAAQAKAQIAEKDKEITKRDTEISSRDKKIVELEKLAADEREKHANDVRDLIAKKNKEFEDYKAEVAAKERRWWINATRIAGLGLIVVGALALVVLKAIPEGAGLIASGTLIGLVSIFIDWLVAQWFFPWLMGLIILAILVAGSYLIYRAWKTKTLHGKTLAALQDLKDEATALGHDTWEKTSEHLKYRLGDKNSFWGKGQIQEVAALGLINPKAEEAPKVDSNKT